MGLIPYGVNPDETWELDFPAVRAKRQIEKLRAAAERLRAKAEKPGGEASLEAANELDRKRAALEAELAEYKPGTGPIFVVGHMPNALRAEIIGESDEIIALPPGVEGSRRDTAWCEKVVRWTVRGHRGLRTASGVEVPFVAEAFTWEGQARSAPSRQTLEAYQEILGDLAPLALLGQRLDEAGKNG